jgi:hypothetical protein
LNRCNLCGQQLGSFSSACINCDNEQRDRESPNFLYWLGAKASYMRLVLTFIFFAPLFVIPFALYLSAKDFLGPVTLLALIVILFNYFLYNRLNGKDASIGATSINAKSGFFLTVLMDTLGFFGLLASYFCAYHVIFSRLF